jgi:hypothetical protein
MGGGNPFNARVVASLVGAGILAFVAFMVLNAYAPEFRQSSNGRPHVMSSSAVGFKGVAKLIGLADGRSYTIRDDAELETADLVVFTLEPMTDPEAVRKLANRRHGKATLLVLPKWMTVPDPNRTGWVRAWGTMGGADGTALLRPFGGLRVAASKAPAAVATGLSELRGLSFPVPASPQTVKGEGIEPLIPGPGGSAILARHGNASLYILADPDLLNNQAMKDPKRAHAALSMLRALSPSEEAGIAFDLTLNGFARRPSALKLAFEPPFVALTLAIFVAALLAGLHGAFRFGPAAEEQRAIAFGKAALVENSAGLFRIARREHRMGGAYADLIREEAAHASAAANLRGEELDSYLDRFSAPDRPRFTELAGRAAAAADRHHLVGAAHALFLWKKDLIQ